MIGVHSGMFGSQISSLRGITFCCLLCPLALTGCNDDGSLDVGGESSAAMGTSTPSTSTGGTGSADASGELTQEALLAGGCFWGMEEWARHLPGVSETSVGYMGGSVEDPTYREVTGGETGHAETVRLVFDPSQMSYEELLLGFFRMHDPTTVNRQGNDVGTQYRSAVFVNTDAERETAAAVIEVVDRSGFWAMDVYTTIEEADVYYEAEEYHQDYLQILPNGYDNHFERETPY